MNELNVCDYDHILIRYNYESFFVPITCVIFVRNIPPLKLNHFAVTFIKIIIDLWLLLRDFTLWKKWQKHDDIKIIQKLNLYSLCVCHGKLILTISMICRK